MRILKSMQAGVLQKSFTYNTRHFLCVSLLWPFRMDTGEPVLETEMWQALTQHFREGRVFDQGMPKDRGEFLCLGSFHAPRSQAVKQEAVSVRVATCEKKLLVTGPRYWRSGGATRPEPIMTLPVRYDQAFGGDGFAENPIGKGFSAEEDGQKPLPCVEYPNVVVTSPSATAPPASFEAMDMGWKQRQQYAGTYDDTYMRTRMPGLPDDVDWRLFNDAPEDQWIDGYFRGDEEFEIIHMHPEKPRLSGQLPGVVGRAFVQRKPTAMDAGDVGGSHEVPLRIDTVWLMPEAELGVIIHRGTTEVETDDATDIVALLAAHEHLADPTRSLDHYRSEMRNRADPEEGYRYMLDTRPLIPVGCPCPLQELASGAELGAEGLASSNADRFIERQQDAASAQAQEFMASAHNSLDRYTDQLPDQISQAQQEIAGSQDGSTSPATETGAEAELRGILSRILPESADGKLDITRMDLRALDDLTEYSERQASEQQEEMATSIREQIDELRRQNDPERDEITQAIQRLEGALSGEREAPPLPRPEADFAVAELEEQAAEIARYEKDLREVGLDEGQLQAALPDMSELRLQLAEARQVAFEGYRESAHYIERASSPHPGEEDSRRDQLLSALAKGTSMAGGDFAFIDLRGATLRDADLSDAYLEDVDFTGATLVNVNLSGAILARSRFVDCALDNVCLVNANLGATSFANTMVRACDCSSARFARCRLHNSTFEHCRFGERPEMFLEMQCTETRFIECEMPETNFFELDLSGCSFRATNLSACNFMQANVAGVQFERADLTGSNFVETPAPSAIFESARMRNVRFLQDPVLNDASFRAADLREANLRSADLVGADFTEASLDGADLSGSDLTNALFTRASAIGTQFNKADMSGIRAYKTDMREASLFKAGIQGASFTSANLYSVSFLHSTIGGTDFSGTNLDNTILKDWTPDRG